ncbi:RNA polymerase sigma-70 factor (ECF subfamily) [Friedmanniella endophytica]|uniref:RNA polymerase sigma-70 factor (ECF subfamily) n=1 Tax=Microlunatus kandeliicorticis TaxID=1759536 RepID=A0A7W3IW50_9ACTN|nr:sigma-70 family RNA polymerase sigma factor [Microlunatus kandeliicorticis]MBA8796240.1 RNA polymerase sigma-70 factor (ECF subfamily) [Microlunatus kandeliicorticis]
MSQDHETAPEELPGRSSVSETALVARAQDGDVESFEILLRRYQGRVYRLAVRMLFDRAEAEDVVQDTFVLVWRRLPTLADPTVFATWVYQIATRRCLSLLRTRGRRQTDPTEQETLTRVQDEQQPDRVEGDPEAAATYAAQLRGLDQVLRTLSDDQRACWVLRELHELSYAEIAYAMQLPVSTVRGRIARARQNIVEGMRSWR